MLVMPAPPSFALPGLVRLRLKRAFSQEALAEESGVSRASIARIEAGKPARIGTLRRLSEALKVEPSELLNGDR